MDGGTTPAVETTGLRKAFGDVVALENLDLRVEAGSFFGFLGPNGAGKSTTIKILTGLLGPTGGSARVLGHDVVREGVAAKRLIGVVSEGGALFERLTGAEYLEFVGRMHGMERSIIRSRSDELLGLMGLAAEGTKLIVDYSHGMQKKISFAAALIHDPKVLFLDEPFEGIDAVTGRLIKTILKQLMTSGATIFLTSHILEIVEKLCSEIAVIDHGRVVAQGNLDELRGRAGGAGTLEELFLDLVGHQSSDSQVLSWLD